MSKEDGGPAFPFGQTDELSGQLVNGWGSEGMTLRDYFAAKASEEDIQYQICAMAPRNGFGEVMSHKVSRSAARYAHADDMLKERTE